MIGDEFERNERMVFARIPVTHWIKAREVLSMGNVLARTTTEPFYCLTDHEARKLNDQDIPFDRLTKDEFNGALAELRDMATEMRLDRAERYQREALSYFLAASGGTELRAAD